MPEENFAVYKILKIKEGEKILAGVPLRCYIVDFGKLEFLKRNKPIRFSH